MKQTIKSLLSFYQDQPVSLSYGPFQQGYS